MSMKLSLDDLAKIQASLREISSLGIQVDQITVGGHKVLLRWEGPEEPYVVGLTNGAVSGGNLRSG